MHTSILTRSTIAVATLGIGSVALAAVPANAAAPSGITRNMVLTAAAGVRSAPPSEGLGNYDATTARAIRGMANRACAIDSEGTEIYFGAVADATNAGGSADGVVITVVLGDATTGSLSPNRVCTFGALATSADRSVLSGTATVNGAPTALSGDVFVTPGVRTSLESGSPATAVIFPAFAATGNATQSNEVKVADKKSTKEKKRAKATYAKRLKAAKKAYIKALDKADGSKSKKKAAKKAYSARKKATKATYRYRIASYRLVVRQTATPFSVAAQVLPAP